MPSFNRNGRPLAALRRGRRPLNLPEPEPKPYTRFIVHKIGSILRSSPWPAAQSELETLNWAVAMSPTKSSRPIPLRWDSHIVNQVLKTHPPLQKAWLFFNWAAAKNPSFRHDKYTYTTMIDMFGEAGRIGSMRHLFKRMVDRGVIVDGVTYTTMMHWLAKAGDLEGSVGMWKEMSRKRHVGKTVVTYTAIMKILFDCGREKEACKVYEEMIEAGLTPNCQTYTVLMDRLAGLGEQLDYPKNLCSYVF